MLKNLLASVLCLAVCIALFHVGRVVPSDLREFEFRVTDHQAGIEDFRKLEVLLESVAIHPKEAARNDGWIELDANFSFIDIVPLKDGRFVSSGKYLVPSGKYDAIKVRFQNVVGELHSDMKPTLSAKDSIVSTSLDLSSTGERIPALVLDLYVESQTDHEPNLYVVKVKEVRVE